MTDNFFTFILIPHSPNRPTVTIKVPKRVFVWLLIIAVFSVLVVLFSVIYSSHLTRKVVSYENLKEKTQVQGQEIEKMSSQAKKIDQKINDLEKKEEAIRKMLGIEKKTPGPLGKSLKNLNNGIMDELNILSQKLHYTEGSIDQLAKTITEMRKRFASIPSIWPTHGRIMSTFGFRVSPWRGFHSGLDINTAYGSKVKSSAVGVVGFVGWRNGYGKTIIVNHGFGTETLYGHLSGFACKVGQRVNKGGLIGYVGMTGFTTGPHLHYEVIKNGIQVNPMSYLDLKLSNAAER